MKKLAWILTALTLLLLFPDLATAIADVTVPVLNYVAGQPLLLGFGLGLAAMPHLTRTLRPAKRA
ncbi:hypothetical protein HW130_03105 [Streptomyces sp. PKU-EA00015]|uniref:hypothetical protein n=1 Tax=Streptomyces sp. PKU-EA00015 TaxID=2748326 RepID=UPI0015A4011C|nr:hypothetical protein [Streptomyces sp. PKU-EA00015]NWF25260.1 hypothetical protein [Streptomyces sp. PKU-EA00015]